MASGESVVVVFRPKDWKPPAEVAQFTSAGVEKWKDVIADALLAAIGAAWALDIAPDLIGAGIKTFEPELQAPVSPRPASVTTLGAH